MTSGNVRWGILGAAEIARKNWKAILNTGNSSVTAVASRDRTRAQRFIDQCQHEAPMPNAVRAFPDYEALLQSTDLDAVYIPLPTGVRKAWVIRAATAGKHVLCEKPCAVSSADLEEMLEACRSHGVQFMDGVMFMHSRRLERLHETLATGEQVGEMRRVCSAFSFRAPPEFYGRNIRSLAELEPHGCVGDLGWYCIRLSLWAMNWRLPQRVTGQMLGQTSAGAPTEFSGELFFEQGVSAAFFCSFLTELQQWAIISGTRGLVRVPDFVLPFAGNELSFEVQRSEFQVKGCDFRMEPGSRRVAVSESSHGQVDSQETNMFRNFSSAVLSGKLNAHWPEWALKTQRVMEACLASARKNGAPQSL